MHDRRSSLYHRHRFPPDIIAEAVWLYFRFPLSFRMVEDRLCRKFIMMLEAARSSDAIMLRAPQR
ncbi:IS6 family transposase, partial [Brucella lupini]